MDELKADEGAKVLAEGQEMIWGLKPAGRLIRIDGNAFARIFEEFLKLPWLDRHPC